MSRLDVLRKARPRSRFLRISLLAMAAFVAYSWLCGDIEVGSFLTERRLENARRFLTREIVPPPVQEAGPGAFFPWSAGLFVERGAQAVLATLGIAVLSILLAGALASLLAPLGASNLATHRPFDPLEEGGLPWRVARTAVRLLLIFLRATPEYLVAFLLLVILGPGTAWPAILALALHNGGILGRLSAETIENLDPRPARALLAIGAPRRSLLFAAVAPQALGRFLLYFFYRFETCVREASILGILGIVSLGYWIEDARAKHYYDEMLFFVVLGASIVILADVLSSLARRYVRDG